jgi:hypothetical protein
MRRTWMLSRRHLLRTTSGAAIGLPWLEAMTDGRTHAQAAPKRLVVVFNPNGTYRPNWLPKGTETEFQLSRILAPLEPFKKDLLVLDGIDLKGQFPSGAVNGHESGMAGFLTGQPLQPGTFSGACKELVGYPAGISVDQAIAKQIGGQTKFRSLELGAQIQPGRTDCTVRMSYSAVNQPLHPEVNPWALFARLFGDLEPTSPQAIQRRKERGTILSGVLGHLRDLQGRVGTDDRRRLDAHLTAVRELEAQLNRAFQTATTCGKPVLPAQPAATAQKSMIYGDSGQLPTVAKLQMDLLAMALACDLTRVASLQFNQAAGFLVYSFLDPSITQFHHGYSHYPDPRPDMAPDALAKANDGWEKMTKIHTWYAAQVAYLCGKLREVQEGTRTVLDSSVVFWGNEFGKGNSHGLALTPFVLIGSGGGHFRTGRFLTYPKGTPHNNLLVSLMNAMGVPATTFGKPEWCTGALPRLTG